MPVRLKQMLPGVRHRRKNAAPGCQTPGRHRGKSQIVSYGCQTLSKCLTPVRNVGPAEADAAGCLTPTEECSAWVCQTPGQRRGKSQIVSYGCQTLSKCLTPVRNAGPAEADAAGCLTPTAECSAWVCQTPGQRRGKSQIVSYGCQTLSKCLTPVRNVGPAEADAAGVSDTDGRMQRLGVSDTRAAPRKNVDRLVRVSDT
jgi:hypothetical protein